MKSKFNRIMFFLGVFLLILVVLSTSSRKKEAGGTMDNIITLPSLPQPIAMEVALITSAGQSTDTYIVRDIANQLMIRNFFMPQAKGADIADIKTIVFVVGYSPTGIKLTGTSYLNEKKRVEQLLNESRSKKLAVITVYAGGKERRGEKTDELLKLTVADSDYLIATQKANYDNYLSQLAKNNHIPLTLVNGINDISEPFISAFR